MRVTVVVPHFVLQVLQPLLRAYHAKQYSVHLIKTNGDVPPLEVIQKWAEFTDAVLLIGSPRRAPKTVVSGPVIACAGGRSVPIGWLPNVGQQQVYTFAQTAARLHQRSAQAQAVAVLSQWHPQYLTLANRIKQLLVQQGKPVFCWSSDLLMREDMVRGLRTGLAVAVYVGHGRPIGWVGYYGTRIHHFENVAGEPIGALLSLCCRTASRRRTSLSFAEAIPLNGIAGAAFGSVNDTKHINNTRWAVQICLALEQGVTSVGELIVKALPLNKTAISDYRLLGDPLAPLYATSLAAEAAAAIPVFP